MSTTIATATPGPRGRPAEGSSGRVLHRYRDAAGATRELTVRAGAHGSLMLLDRDPLEPGAERLVAHLAADEPRRNALLAARLYLDSDPDSRRCRALEHGDEEQAPLAAPVEPRPAGGPGDETVSVDGRSFRLRRVRGSMSIPSLRWVRETGAVGANTRAPLVVSLREAIGEAESYEPFCELTRIALGRHERDASVSSTVLRAELARVLSSPIVLNRGLREAVVASVSRGEATMSEIAMRCGRMKRDSRGNTTGETSWLARRVGLLPEGGAQRPTRWVHSDVLALIARHGLGIAPREVELG
jgi:hypothetical protein